MQIYHFKKGLFMSIPFISISDFTYELCCFCFWCFSFSPNSMEPFWFAFNFIELIWCNKRSSKHFNFSFIIVLSKIIDKHFVAQKRLAFYPKRQPFYLHTVTPKPMANCSTIGWTVNISDFFINISWKCILILFQNIFYPIVYQTTQKRLAF